MITTSRYASENTRKFARRLATKLETLYVSRGKKTIEGIVEHARKKGESEIIVVEEKDEVPEYVSVIEVSETGSWKWVKRSLVKEYEG